MYEQHAVNVGKRRYRESPNQRVVRPDQKVRSKKFTVHGYIERECSKKK